MTLTPVRPGFNLRGLLVRFLPGVQCVPQLRFAIVAAAAVVAAPRAVADDCGRCRVLHPVAHAANRPPHLRPRRSQLSHSCHRLSPLLSLSPPPAVSCVQLPPLSMLSFVSASLALAPGIAHVQQSRSAVRASPCMMEQTSRRATQPAARNPLSSHRTIDRVKAAPVRVGGERPRRHG